MVTEASLFYMYLHVHFPQNLQQFRQLLFCSSIWLAFQMEKKLLKMEWGTFRAITWISFPQTAVQRWSICWVKDSDFHLVRHKHGHPAFPKNWCTQMLWQVESRTATSTLTDSRRGKVNKYKLTLLGQSISILDISNLSRKKRITNCLSVCEISQHLIWVVIKPLSLQCVTSWTA